MNQYVLFVLLVSMATVLGGPMQLYKKTKENTYRRVLVPVSSTVIPLDDLPEFQVGIGFNVGGAAPTQLIKPEGNIKLVTVKELKKKLQKKKTFKKNSGAVVEEIEQ